MVSCVRESLDLAPVPKFFLTGQGVKGPDAIGHVRRSKVGLFPAASPPAKPSSLLP